MSRTRYTALLTNTRSPGRRVFSIEPVGMKNDWTSSDLTTSARTSAIASSSGSSRRNDRFFCTGAGGTATASVPSASACGTADEVDGAAGGVGDEDGTEAAAGGTDPAGGGTDPAGGGTDARGGGTDATGGGSGAEVGGTGEPGRGLDAAVAVRSGGRRTAGWDQG